MKSFADNVVIFTGASHDIGEQLAYLLAAQGAKATVTARSEDRLQAVARRNELVGTGIAITATYPGAVSVERLTRLLGENVQRSSAITPEDAARRLLPRLRAGIVRWSSPRWCGLHCGLTVSFRG